MTQKSDNHSTNYKGFEDEIEGRYLVLCLCKEHLNFARITKAYAPSASLEHLGGKTINKIYIELLKNREIIVWNLDELHSTDVKFCHAFGLFDDI